jgi:hypothetical protein
MQLGLRASLAGAILAATGCGSSFSSSTTADAGTAADASTPDAPLVPQPSYCAAHMGLFAFCEDFDKFPDVTQFLASWTTFSSTGGSFSFDQTNVPSPPNALNVATTSASGVRTLAIHVMPAPTGPVARQRLEFDFLVDDASNVGLASAGAVAAILFGGDVTGGAVALAFGNGSGSTATLAAMYQGPLPGGTGIPAFGSSNAPPPFPSLGLWDGRFAIEITYPNPDAGTSANNTACAQLYIGGIAQLTPCLTLPASLSHPAATTSIALGVYSGGAGNSGNIGVGFDNVTFVGQ